MHTLGGTYFWSQVLCFLFHSLCFGLLPDPRMIQSEHGDWWSAMNSSWETGGAVFNVHKLLFFDVIQDGKSERRNEATRSLR